MTTLPPISCSCSRARRKNRLLARATLAALVPLASLAVWSVACSTIEPIAFSNGECVAGGCVQSGATSSGASSSSSGAMICQDAGCTVSWATDIYAGIFGSNIGCANATLCHGSPASKGGLTLDPAMASAAYTTLSGYTLLATPGPAKPYIVPCDTGSGILCNMVVDDGDGGTSNPFGTCGSPMPKGGVHKLTVAQLNTIAKWIQCGALNN